jgi:hypothetical protein
MFFPFIAFNKLQCRHYSAGNMKNIHSLRHLGDWPRIGPCSHWQTWVVNLSISLSVGGTGLHLRDCFMKYDLRDMRAYLYDCKFVDHHDVIQHRVTGLG